MVTPRFQLRRRQRGAALAVGLIILLVMTVLAVSMSQTTRLQERVAGNARDISVAQQSVESALRAGETAIKEMVSTAYCAACDVKPPNHYYAATNPPITFASRDSNWWISNGNAFGNASAKEISAAYRDPHYVIEHRGSSRIGGSLAVDAPTRTYFVVTAEGTGVVDDTQMVVSTVYTRND